MVQGLISLVEMIYDYYVKLNRPLWISLGPHLRWQKQTYIWRDKAQSGRPTTNNSLIQETSQAFRTEWEVMVTPKKSLGL